MAAFCSHQQDGHALGPDGLEDLEDLLHEDGREAEGGFVEQDQLRLAHQRAADGEHHLLAARQLVAGHGAALGKDGEAAVDVGKILRHAVRVAAQVGADLQVFRDGEVAEDLPGFRAVGNAGGDDLFRLHGGQVDGGRIRVGAVEDPALARGG